MLSLSFLLIALFAWINTISTDKVQVSKDFKDWYSANKNNIKAVQQNYPNLGQIHSIISYPQLPKSIREKFEVTIQIYSPYPRQEPLNYYAVSSETINGVTYVVWTNRINISDFKDYPCYSGFKSGFKICSGKILFYSEYLRGTGLLDFPEIPFQVGYQFEGHDLVLLENPSDSSSKEEKSEGLNFLE